MIATVLTSENNIDLGSYKVHSMRKEQHHLNIRKRIHGNSVQVISITIEFFWLYYIWLSSNNTNLFDDNLSLNEQCPPSRFMRNA